MAKSISDEELQLRKRARRRLVGAIALVTIIAVFLPMVLDHEPKPVSQDVSIKIPSPDSGVFTSKIVPVVPAQKPAPAPKPEAAVPAEPPPAKADAPKIAAAVPAAKPAGEPSTPPAYDTEAAPPKKASPEKAAPAQPAEKPVAAEPVKAVEKAKAADKAKPPAKGAGGYVVQVAALNDPEKAKQMRDQIAATGVKAYTEVVPTAKGNVTRVRGGPFASRADADKARDKLKGIGLNGNVIPR